MASRALRSRLLRFAQVGPAERYVVLASLTLLPPLTFALHLRGMAHARALAATLARALPAPGRELSARRVSELVASVADGLTDQRVPHFSCLARALVTCALLERRGERPTLQLGVRRDAPPSEQLDAHAWVELDGEVLSDGADVAARYAPLVGA